VGMTIDGSKRGIVSDPNIVPLIDVLLVLIIIFMVITPNAPSGLPTLIPQPSHESRPESRDSDVIVVGVMQGGRLLINQQPSDWDTLGKALEEIFTRRADKIAFVKGADEVPFSQVARAIDIMRGAGIDHIGLISAAQQAH
jgi:biopolymer transport protein TolR